MQCTQQPACPPPLLESVEVRMLQTQYTHKKGINNVTTEHYMEFLSRVTRFEAFLSLEIQGRLLEKWRKKGPFLPQHFSILVGLHHGQLKTNQGHDACWTSYCYIIRFSTHPAITWKSFCKWTKRWSMRLAVIRANSYKLFTAIYCRNSCIYLCLHILCNKKFQAPTTEYSNCLWTNFTASVNTTF